MIAEGEDESRFERIRQLTHDNAPCYTIKRLKGRHPLNGPWCIGLRAVVPNKIPTFPPRLAAKCRVEAGQVNVVHVSSFQEIR